DVVRLRISNPQRRGALDHPILDAIASVLPTLEARCVVITGEAEIFSAGYDLGNLEGEMLAEEADRLVAHPFTAALDAIEAYPYPTVAALNGHAIGGGLELALACDLRMAAEEVSVGMPPAKLGLVYSHTGIRKFIDAIGAARTRELFLVGRRVDAHTAHAWGLVNYVVSREQLEEESLRLAEEIAANAPIAQRGNKRVIRAVVEAEASLDGDTEAALIDLRRASLSSEDFREAVSAFAEKRRPVWRDR
ncbi:MAG TPA: enoyl-CoA hydratase-related protein, partial [Solirubrobacteraceae bacterium]|nr:enoyl-CoA hydratase-related protein [Solirubrobacteraceae bacterium]